MYKRWLYTHEIVPLKNLEVKRYKCGHYYIRDFTTSPNGTYVLYVSPLRKVTKKQLIEILEHYFLYGADIIDGDKD